MELLLDFDIILILITLTFLEVVLGIDNVIFISLAIQKLPKELRKKARYFGISLALIIRCLMLFALVWIMSLTKPAITIHDVNFSYKEIILFFGGLFLIYTSTKEIIEDLIDNNIDNIKNHKTEKKLYIKSTLSAAIMQIMIIDIVFSLDSIITAIGITDKIGVIIIAVIISMAVMLFLSGKISMIIDKFPTLKILALCFIYIIGLILVLEGFAIHIDKNYLYFALFFSLIVEVININTIRKKDV